MKSKFGAPPALDETVRPNPVQLFDMMEGYRPVRNLLGIGDPDVHRIDGRWWMFFGALHTGFRNNLFSASLPPDAPLSSNEWMITTSPLNARRALPLVEQPPKGSWDHYGLHNPSYAAGKNPDGEGRSSQSERIYYTGRNSRSILENDRPLSIGVMEKTPEGWIRHAEPVLQGTPEYPSVLEPKARYFGGKWRLWYVATPQVAGKKSPPVYQVRYVESTNGISGWSEPKVLFSTREGYYDAVVTAVDGRYEMVVCRSGNLGGKADFPPQGIWWLSSKSPSGNRGDWTGEPVQILDADQGTADWYASGITDTSVQYEGNTMFIFFTGVHQNTEWSSVFLRRLLAFRKPPFPAPFYLSIGRAQYKRPR